LIAFSQISPAFAGCAGHIAADYCAAADLRHYADIRLLMPPAAGGRLRHARLIADAAIIALLLHTLMTPTLPIRRSRPQHGYHLIAVGFTGATGRGHVRAIHRS